MIKLQGKSSGLSVEDFDAILYDLTSKHFCQEDDLKEGEKKIFLYQKEKKNEGKKLDSFENVRVYSLEPDEERTSLT